MKTAKTNVFSMKNDETSAMQYLVITSGKHYFALPTACVRKIISTLPITPIPFVPSSIDGLINVDGTIAIQVNLATLSNTTHTGRTELILIDTGRALCALQAERIIERTHLTSPSLLMEAPPIDINLLAGMVQHANNSVYILDPQRIGELIQTSPLHEGTAGILGKIADNNLTEDRSTIACLTVSIGKDQYAFELQSVVEILEAGGYTTIPDAPIGLLGFFLLREQTIPVIALADLLTTEISATEQAWLIVIEREGILYSVLVNQLLGVQKFPFANFQPIIDANQKISGMFIHEETTTLLLSPQQIIDASMIDFLAPYVEKNTSNTTMEKEETNSFLKVMLGEKPFIIPLKNVKRIVPFFPMNHLDDKTDNICGAINIEGKIIPVLAIEKILKIKQSHTYNEYIIVGDDAQDWAICVEAAQHIVQIPLSSIHSESTTDFRPLSGIARIAEELIPLLNPNLFSLQRSTQD
jgi:chemotaxis signal transduction protein